MTEKMTPAPCPNTKEGLEFVLDELKREVEQEFFQKGGVGTKALLLYEVPHRDNTHQLEEMDLEECARQNVSPEIMVNIIRKQAKSRNAYGVFMIFESFTKEAGKTIVRDGISILVDHIVSGKCLHQADIKEKNGKKVITEFFHVESNTPPFAGFLDHDAAPGIH